MTPSDDSAKNRSRARRFEQLEYWLYAAACGVVILAVARLFFSSMRLQTLMTTVSPSTLIEATQQRGAGEWSAPLDDVFIHFDFARAWARGYPFQWSEGNGYSSGGTSLLYPPVLALGYWVGFRGQSLMLWAGVVACVSIMGTLLAARRLFRNLPWYASYIAPLALFGVGALNWTLFSGMEVALFLGFWGAAFVAWDGLIRSARDVQDVASNGRLIGLACGLGAGGLLLVGTRPEAAVVVALMGTSAAWVVWRHRNAKSALWVLVIAGAPAALLLVAHAAANQHFTGDSSSAGAVTKLELHHPHLNRDAVIDAWKFHLKYQVLRITHYHMSEVPGFGWIIWALALIATFSRRTRGAALLLWFSAAAWIMIVALNGQVRWQNERYTMPATAWLMLCAGLGLGVLISSPIGKTRRARLTRLGLSGLGLAAATVYGINQAPRFREQVWFFGRASRNIRDQHIVAGRLLRRIEPRPRRVLVGDAGALTYASDLPGLDIIGLGGFGDYPFARATKWGVPASLELIERMPPEHRPDVMALYPSWWGTLPLWFGRKLVEVPVRGNVICGGLSKVIYRADWRPLNGSERPVNSVDHPLVRDELDVADLVSEKQHDYRIDGAVGYVKMKMLAHPQRPSRDLWDAGRTIHQGASTSFRFGNLRAGSSAELLLRTAPAQRSEIAVDIDGKLLEVVVLRRSDQWSEVRVPVPSARVREGLTVTLRQKAGERILYHAWVLQSP